VSDTPTEVERLKAERERVLTDLYATRPHVDPGRQVPNLQHKELETRYNDVEKQLHELAGRPEDEYRYRRDVRHEFRFEAETHRTRDGTFRVEAAEGPVYHPDTVINWRNTEVGAAKDRELRAETRRRYGAQRGDDVGHRIALSAGVDPVEARNVGLQNFVQNEGGGTYHKYEAAQREWLATHPGEHLQIRVEECYHEGRFGTERAVARRCRLKDENGELAFRDNLVFANPRAANGRVRVQVPEPAVAAEPEGPAADKPRLRVVR
jgi:hypothetical protein